MTAINLTRLTLYQGPHLLLKDFTAAIAAGEFIGIFGANGSGKTSLLRALLGQLKPHSGAITIFNQPPQANQHLIGYMPQNRQLQVNNYLSGRARLAAVSGGYRWGLPLLSKQQKEEIEWLLHRVQALAFANKPYSQLSGGQQQRILLAASLLNQPQLLLLDEPLANLDPYHQESLIALISQLQQELKVTILFTAHDVNPLLEVMNRVLYIAHGKAALGTVAEVISSSKLSWLYGTPIEVIRYQQRLLVISADPGVNTSHA